MMFPRRTWFNRFLCWLGVHQLVTAANRNENGRLTSIVGGCVHCPFGVGWDL